MTVSPHIPGVCSHALVLPGTEEGLFLDDDN